MKGWTSQSKLIMRKRKKNKMSAEKAGFINNFHILGIIRLNNNIHHIFITATTIFDI